MSVSGARSGLGHCHPPVAEAVDGDRPEPLLQQVAVVGSQVLAQQRDETDPRRIAVPVPPVQGRRSPDLLAWRRLQQTGHFLASKKLKRMKSHKISRGSLLGLRKRNRLTRYETWPSDHARSASNVLTRP